MSLIIPALLTSNREELRKMLKLCEEFEPLPSVVHVDLMDGKFVPSTGISQTEIMALYSRRSPQVHLMVRHPLFWLEDIYTFGARSVCFHFEISPNPKEIARAIRKEGFGFKVGLAVNPDTLLPEFSPLLGEVNFLLLLTVYPGFYGAEFQPQVLKKVREVKTLYPHLPVGIDGGVKLSNLKEIVSTGVDFVCVGSAIMKSKEPRLAYESFVRHLSL